jgi:hypothetical protein
MAAFERGGGDGDLCSSVRWWCIEALNWVWQYVSFWFDGHRIFHLSVGSSVLVCGAPALYSREFPHRKSQSGNNATPSEFLFFVVHFVQEGKSW